jgi:long-subunit fatty acid transport protein
MRCFRFLVFFVCVAFSVSWSGHLSASGLDSTLIYGSRQVGLGGQQISISTDAYAPFYNPAALAGIENHSLAFGTSPLFVSYEAPIGLSSEQRKSELTIAPLFYGGAAYRLNERVILGLGFYPTALQGGKFKNVDYSDDLQNKTLELALYRFELSPSAALSFSEHVSAGVSWRIGYTKIKSKAGVFAGPAGAFLSSDLSKWDFKGLKLGLHLNDFHGFNAGLTFRLKNEINFKGDTTIEDDGLGLLGGLPKVENIPTSLKLPIPAQFQAGISYEWIPETFLTAFTWEFTWNSVVNRLTRLNRDTGAVIADVETSWKNANTIHLGAEYSFALAHARKIRTSAGFAWDQVTTRAHLPNPVGPPANHYYGGSLGVQYLWGQHIVGLAGNYGAYSRRSTAVPAGNAVFPGKYKLTAYQVVADYQISF